METVLEESVSKKKINFGHSQKSIEEFIKENIEKPNRPVVKTTMRQITERYWRVNLWGKKLNSECQFGDSEILISKFVRVDIGDNGELVYNDVSEGSSL